MSAIDRIPERLRGGTEVNVMRLDATRVAVVFHMASAEDADRLEANALAGLRRGEFRMRLRGKVTAEERTDG